MISDGVLTQLIVSITGAITTISTALILRSNHKTRRHVDQKVDPIDKKVDEIQKEQKEAKERRQSVPVETPMEISVEPEVKQNDVRP